MEDISPTQLEAMGLEPQRATVDERPMFSDWTRKAILHAALKLQAVADRPKTDEFFRFAKGVHVVSSVRCNMGIHIIKISCIIPAGNGDGTDKALPDEYYLCKKETGVWSMKYLTTSGGSHKSNAHLKQTSELNNYCISQYNEYVPTQVMNSITKYKDLYYAKYQPGNLTLTNAMMDATFCSFKCDYAMEEDGVIDEHVREVHNIAGIESMKPVQRIEVDTKAEYVLPSLLDIEIFGPDKRGTTIHSLYTRSVARNVVSKTNNKIKLPIKFSRLLGF